MEITKPSEYFEKALPAMASEKPGLLVGLAVVAQWNVHGGGACTWTTVVKDGRLECREEPADEPEITIDMDGDTLLAIYEGTLKPATAFMTKKLKLSGDVEKALKLAVLLQEERV